MSAPRPNKNRKSMRLTQTGSRRVRRSQYGLGDGTETKVHPEVQKVLDFEAYLQHVKMKEMESKLFVEKANDRIRKDIGHNLCLPDAVFGASSLCLTVETMLISIELGYLSKFGDPQSVATNPYFLSSIEVGHQKERDPTGVPDMMNRLLQIHECTDYDSLGEQPQKKEKGKAAQGAASALHAQLGWKPGEGGPVLMLNQSIFGASRRLERPHLWGTFVEMLSMSHRRDDELYRIVYYDLLKDSLDELELDSCVDENDFDDFLAATQSVSEETRTSSKDQPNLSKQKTTSDEEKSYYSDDFTDEDEGGERKKSAQAYSERNLKQYLYLSCSPFPKDQRCPRPIREVLKEDGWREMSDFSLKRKHAHMYKHELHIDQDKEKNLFKLAALAFIDIGIPGKQNRFTHLLPDSVYRDMALQLLDAELKKKGKIDLSVKKPKKQSRQQEIAAKKEKLEKDTMLSIFKNDEKEDEGPPWKDAEELDPETHRVRFHDVRYVDVPIMETVIATEEVEEEDPETGLPLIDPDTGEVLLKTIELYETEEVEEYDSDDEVTLVEKVVMEEQRTGNPVCDPVTGMPVINPKTGEPEEEIIMVPKKKYIDRPIYIFEQRRDPETNEPVYEFGEPVMDPVIDEETGEQKFKTRSEKRTTVLEEPQVINLITGEPLDRNAWRRVEVQVPIGEVQDSSEELDNTGTQPEVDYAPARESMAMRDGGGGLGRKSMVGSPSKSQGVRSLATRSMRGGHLGTGNGIGGGVVNNGGNDGFDDGNQLNGGLYGGANYYGGVSLGWYRGGLEGLHADDPVPKDFEDFGKSEATGYLRPLPPTATEILKGINDGSTLLPLSAKNPNSFMHPQYPKPKTEYETKIIYYAQDPETGRLINKQTKELILNPEEKEGWEPRMREEDVDPDIRVGAERLKEMLAEEKYDLLEQEETLLNTGLLGLTCKDLHQFALFNLTRALRMCLLGLEEGGSLVVIWGSTPLHETLFWLKKQLDNYFDEINILAAPFPSMETLLACVGFSADIEMLNEFVYFLSRQQRQVGVDDILMWTEKDLRENARILEEASDEFHDVFVDVNKKVLKLEKYVIDMEKEKILRFVEEEKDRMRREEEARLRAESEEARRRREERERLAELKRRAKEKAAQKRKEELDRIAQAKKEKENRDKDDKESKAIQAEIADYHNMAARRVDEEALAGRDMNVLERLVRFRNRELIPGGAEIGAAIQALKAPAGGRSPSPNRSPSPAQFGSGDEDPGVDEKAVRKVIIENMRPQMHSPPPMKAFLKTKRRKPITSKEESSDSDEDKEKGSKDRAGKSDDGSKERVSKDKVRNSDDEKEGLDLPSEKERGRKKKKKGKKAKKIVFDDPRPGWKRPWSDVPEPLPADYQSQMNHNKARIALSSTFGISALDTFLDTEMALACAESKYPEKDFTSEEIMKKMDVRYDRLRDSGDPNVRRLANNYMERVGEADKQKRLLNEMGGTLPGDKKKGKKMRLKALNS